MLKNILNEVSVFSTNTNNQLGYLGDTLADFYYYNNLHLQELIARVQSAGNELGKVSSLLETYFADMVSDVHNTMLDTVRIRNAAESVEGYAQNTSIYTAEIYNDVNTIADSMVGWSDTFDQMSKYLLGIGNNSADIYTTNKSILSKVDSIQTAVSLTNSKLDDLIAAAASTYDDTALLGRLDALSGGMQTVNNRLSAIYQYTGKLLDLFSLGETKTLEIQANGYTTFNYVDLGSIQSVRVSGTDDSGFIIFGVGGASLDFVTTIAECNGGDVPLLDYCWSVDVSTNTLTITVPSHPASAMFSRVPAGTYTVSLLDASGSLISLATGDKLRPSSTMSRWEVLRTDGSVVSIAGCSGIPDGCDFADIAPRCARVLVRDLVAAPSLLTSYADAVSYDIGSGNFYSFFQLINTSGAALTVEYVTPSPLLNWYANRQDDFRYWLDTRLSSLPAGKSAEITADLTEVTSRLDTLIENAASKTENTVINITTDNDAYNVFYIEGEDGDTQSVTDFTKSLSGASGRLLSMLYRLVFADALDTVDGDLDSFEDFFTSTEPTEDVSTQSAGGDMEEVDIWSAF